MVAQAVVDSVAVSLRQHFPNLTLNRAGNLSLDHIRFKPETIYSVLIKKAGRGVEAALIKQHIEVFEEFTSSGFGSQLITALTNLLKREPPEADCETLYFNSSLNSPLSKIKFISNVDNQRRCIIYDSVEDVYQPYDREYIEAALSAQLDSKSKAYWLATNQEDCRLEYLPLQPRITKEEDHQIFNLWTPATWQRTYTPVVYGTPDQTLPSEVDKFLSALVEHAEDRYSMEAWMRDCAFSKANPILILCGTPGIGKNIFVNICRALVGPQNYKEATRGFANSQFHNNITTCRLYFSDETDLTPKVRDIFKAYHNGLATVERKFENVGKPEKVHASFCLANNFKEHIKLEYTDRKFYAPKLSEIPLLEKMPQAEVDHLMKVCLEDPEYLKQIARYLEATYKPNESEKFKKGEFFRELCINSYPHYFKRFIKACETMESFTQKTLTQANARHKVDVADILKHVEHYEKTFKVPLASVVSHLNGTWTATSKIYKPSEESADAAEGLLI